MAEPDLLPCPFCGDLAGMERDDHIFARQHYDDYPGQEYGFRVECRGQCHSMTCWWHTEAEAIAAWNRRAPTCAPDPTNAEVSDERVLGIAMSYDEIDTILDEYPIEGTTRDGLREDIAELLSTLLARSGNYVASHDTFPSKITFANGRTVSLSINGEYLTVSSDEAQPIFNSPRLTRRSVTSQASEGADNEQRVAEVASTLHDHIDIPSFKARLLAVAILNDLDALAAPQSKRVERLEAALSQIDRAWEAATSGVSTDIPNITGWTGALDNLGQIFAWVARQALQGGRS